MYVPHDCPRMSKSRVPGELGYVKEDLQWSESVMCNISGAGQIYRVESH